MKKLVPTRHGAFLYAERINPSLDVASAWNFVTRPPRGPYAERINPSLDVTRPPRGPSRATLPRATTTEGADT